MFRIGLIGCGEYCSNTHAQALSKMEHVEITAISECIYPGELARRQQQFRIPYAFLSYQDMLNSVKLDAVVISTPHALHFSQTKDCLEFGLHVLVDKPPAFRAEDIQVLVDLANSKRCYFLVASQRRYDPLFRYLRERAHNGELGKLNFIEFHYGRSMSSNFATSWRNNPVLSGGGILFDAAYHMIDGLLWITNGHPLRVRGGLKQNETQVHTSASLTLELMEDTLVSISVHLEMPPNMVWEEIGFYGSRGTFLYQRTSLPDGILSARLIEIRLGQQSCKELQNNKEIDQAPVRNFISAILDQEPVISSGQESINTVRTIEWIYQELDKQSGE
jgi:predicted dehydrogenase